jgi:hypothetical protein
MEMNEPYKPLKMTIDEILNVSSMVRRKKKAESDKNTELFRQIINTLELINTRTFLAEQEFGLNLNSYDEKFLEVIDALLYMTYGKECYELISFYLFHRFNDDGTINPVLIEETGEEIRLTSPYELYSLMKTVNPKIK